MADVKVDKSTKDTPQKDSQYYNCIGLVYSPDAGDGKTFSLMQSLRRPIYCIYNEERDATLPFEVLGLKEGKDIKVYYPPDDHMELIDHCIQIEEDIKAGKFPYQSVMFDSLGYWFNTRLLREKIKETRDAKIFALKRKLTDGARTDQSDFGAMPFWMTRAIESLKRISQQGITVMMTAQSMEAPKWNRDLGLAPYLIGNQLGREIKSHFDIIGLLSSRREKTKNRKIFPPKIQFDSPDGDFMYKWALPTPPGGYDDEGYPIYTVKADFSEILKKREINN